MKLFTILILTLMASSVFGQGTDLHYNEGTTKLKGYLVKPKGLRVKAPGVVILHAWMGLTDHERESAEELGKLGYVALAADAYGENEAPKTVQDAGKLSGYYKLNRNIYRARIKAAIDQVIKAGADPEKIAVIGYCFGGTGALEAARANFPVKGVVSFHGGLDKGPEETSLVKPKVLVLHGADDPFVPKEQADAFQNEMRAAKADWQMVYYADAVHSFTEPKAGTDKSKGAAYNEAAARRSWAHMKLFFTEIFAK
ncbi:dienelactone hydrolase family protein [Desertivirga arenae]|uniref:dienelactone hydrolase family protein n=1 Tax=Desertivirga arenae TaxID=2810309 RepID=UPI001A97B482|nr:dienelactone hydrolase family protein [Pedobacter sp. SYSU D00823]